MTTDRVLSSSEISLDGVRYKLNKSVVENYGSRYAPKFVTGDKDKDSHEKDSIWAPTFEHGIGKNKIHPSDPSRRAWWATWQLRYDHQLVPLALAFRTAASAETGVFDIGAIGTYRNAIFAAFGVEIYKYSDAVDSQGSSVRTLDNLASDAITFRLGSKDYIAFAHGGGYDYWDNSSWADSDQNTQFFAFWDDRLWGIDSTGRLWYSYVMGGTESPDAQLPLPDDSVTSMFVAPNEEGDLVIHVGTTEGLYIHDNTFTRLREKLPLATHPDNCKGAARWNGDTFISSGLGMRQIANGGDRRGLVVSMGLDRDDGLPSEWRGTISHILTGHNDLLVTVSKTAAAALVDSKVTKGFGSHRGVIMDPDVGSSAIYGWDTSGWEVKWISPDNAQGITAAHVSNAYGSSRLWWGLGDRLYYVAIPRDILNPQESSTDADFRRIGTVTYEETAELITPWLEPDRDANNVGIYLKVDTAELVSETTERVLVEQATDNDVDNYTTLGTITTNGVTTFNLPTATDRSGVEFLSTRFRITGTRGSNTLLKPVIRSIVLGYLRELPAKYDWQIELDLSKPYNNQTPKQMRASLKGTIESNPFVVFSMRNDSDTDLGSTDRRFYVNVERAQNIQETGEDETGISNILLTEV